MHVTVCWKLRARYSSGAYPASGRPNSPASALGGKLGAEVVVG